MTEDVKLHVLHTMDEFAIIVELQQQIWGMARADTVSPYIMNAISHNGGAIIAAETDGQMVGFCLGFASKRGDSMLFWSHMAGVLPGYQGRRIGFLLKQEQRRWALDTGYDTISWTFDPLQRGNANFNFTHLGATAHTYLVNVYGEMTDEINAGLASDRLEAHWSLNDARVVALAEGAPPDNSDSYDDTVFLVSMQGAQLIGQLPSDWTEDVYFIEIPYDIGTLKKSDKSKAIAWQLAVRKAMLAAFENGYSARDFIISDGRCRYIVRRK